MSATVQCTKCGAEKPALAAPPFRPGTKLAPLGAEIQSKICAACYREWIDMSVKLVNELRLDTTDPRGQELWLKQMKLFLGLEEGGDPWGRFLDKKVAVETTGGATVTATLVGLDERALSLADFEGGSVPEGFSPGAAKGSATIARDHVRTLTAAS
ncbi:MAG: Fe(2+)-trafficking protein [Polyangiales bacterium]